VGNQEQGAWFLARCSYKAPASQTEIIPNHKETIMKIKYWITAALIAVAFVLASGLPEVLIK
jgi:hypothetical protein